jgi:hypothetical protein
MRKTFMLRTLSDEDRPIISPVSGLPAIGAMSSAP